MPQKRGRGFLFSWSIEPKTTSSLRSRLDHIIDVIKIKNYIIYRERHK